MKDLEFPHVTVKVTHRMNFHQRSKNEIIEKCDVQCAVMCNEYTACRGRASDHKATKRNRSTVNEYST